MIDVSGGSPVETWAHADRLGSVIATTGGAGAVADKYRYSPYGKPGAEGAGGFPFRYTGQKLDLETGLYYYKARYYDPDTGRFLQVDPIGYEDQMNLYAYVGNDPLNLVDSTGLHHEPTNEEIEEVTNRIETLEKTIEDLRQHRQEETEPGSDEYENVTESIRWTEQEKSDALHKLNALQQTKRNHEETHRNMERLEKAERTLKVGTCGVAGSAICQPAKHPVAAAVCAGAAAVACDEALDEKEEEDD